MANNSTGNPIYLDSTGGVFSGNVDWYFTGVVVNASADVWAVVLKDSAGRVVYEGGQTLTGDRYKTFAPASSFRVTGLVVDTLTNITSVIVYKG